MIGDLDLWYAVLFLLIGGLIGFFLRSLKFSEKFQARQELRRAHHLEKKRSAAAAETAQRAITEFVKHELKKP